MLKIFIMPMEKSMQIKSSRTSKMRLIGGILACTSMQACLVVTSTSILELHHRVDGHQEIIETMACPKNGGKGGIMEWPMTIRQTTSMDASLRTMISQMLSTIRWRLTLQVIKKRVMQGHKTLYHYSRLLLKAVQTSRTKWRRFVMHGMLSPLDLTGFHLLSKSTTQTKLPWTDWSISSYVNGAAANILIQECLVDNGRWFSLTMHLRADQQGSVWVFSENCPVKS